MEIIKDKNDIKYLEAKKRVKQLKGFYSHLTIYILVNLLIVFINIQDLKPGESYFKVENFITLFFWGIGLLAHAMGVFVPQFVLGKNWEERKIRELMEKDK
ncbi:2TM domain-containing protein [Epilithonimonas ginsengisoli]|uniref:2TM domain-containing protein n=1 Tax=Epilithonimonas ginsengisoli TaxID=1245592 RepID=A0ABU4JEM9_9FLAO|nr:MULTISPECIES: 2TM domain-containing protein [Chryseobacterium group]MBO6201875.1 2TM domain-containing protein [Chryseobacterium sp.]MBV6879322.1 2TM domain-containing protein [Epilithonimonas sp. FP105]MDW8547981.1 2TM domain-containing protein [Epilithonimonas ginsengisoli]OAH73097.1 histidine kinase [Chryseobacterium sp. FP211-J200]